MPGERVVVSRRCVRPSPAGAARSGVCVRCNDSFGSTWACCILNTARVTILSEVTSRIHSMCSTLTGLVNTVVNLYRNPVIDRDFPDPSVIRASDGYYYNVWCVQRGICGR